MNSGIYFIENKITSDIYVGSTINFRTRKSIHFNDLKANRHHSIVLQRAYNKYGSDSLDFKIIAKCPNEYLLKLEQWFLDSTKPKYNICIKAGSRLGLKCSQEHKDKVGEANKGRPCKEHLKDYFRKIHQERKSYLKLAEVNRKKVAQYSISGNLIRVFESIKEAAKNSHTAEQSISANCRNKRKSANGYQWVFINNTALIKIEPIKMRSNSKILEKLQ